MNKNLVLIQLTVPEESIPENLKESVDILKQIVEKVHKTAKANIPLIITEYSPGIVGVDLPSRLHFARLNIHKHTDGYTALLLHPDNGDGRFLYPTFVGANMAFTSTINSSNKDEIIDKLFDGYDAVASEPLTQEEKDSFGLAISYTAGVCALWHELNGTRYAGNYLGFGAEA